jgi:two-component system sensor histidine kinase AlgZ
LAAQLCIQITALLQTARAHFTAHRCHPNPARKVLVFDACNAGVVLRAVLFVQVVVSTAALYGADSLWEWFSSAALLTGACLPGTLVWLIAACSLKHQLQRLGTRGQYLAGVLLGALAGFMPAACCSSSA